MNPSNTSQAPLLIPDEPQPDEDYHVQITPDVVDGEAPAEPQSAWEIDQRSAGINTYRQWIALRVNWSWFTATQSTGGIAILLSECPKQFAGLEGLGVIISLLTLILWLSFAGLMMIRFTTRPSKIRESLTQVPECFYLGTFWISGATLIICLQEYAVPHTNGNWIITVIRVLFWLYATVTLSASILHIVALSKLTPIKAIEMNPGWFLMIYGPMITGTMASAIARAQPLAHRLPIIVAGIAFQGFGWIGSMLLMAWFVGHLLEKGGPAAKQSPGLFMTVGSVGFTAAALIGISRALPSVHEDGGVAYFQANPDAAEFLRLAATWIGISIWVFGLFLLGLASVTVVSNLLSKSEGSWTLSSIEYNNTFWAFVFPNVGFTMGTIYIGQELQSESILWLTVVMTAMLVCLWVTVSLLMAKTIYLSLRKNSEYTLL